jgi:hypothetical protein
MTNRGVYDAACVRRISNWTSLEKEHKFDKDTFDPKKFLLDLPIASPKLTALLTKIKELDDNDMRLYGRKFKHFIFSEVKAGGYGAKVVCSGLMAAGLNLCYTSSMALKTEQELLEQKYDNFGYLCSTTVYEQTMPITLKKNMLLAFNSRPQNIHGDLIRIMVADGGFKEGIDLFDVKYVHLFEPLVSEADQKQAIGRSTRKCGQAGLTFVPIVGWTLNVYIYDTLLSERLLAKLDSNSLFDLYLKNSNIDFKKMNFGKQLEQLVLVGSVDYPLNKNLITSVDDEREPLFGGDIGNETNQNNTSPPINQPNVVVTNPMIGPQNTQSTPNTPPNTLSPPKPKRTPLPPKLGDKVYCHRMCSINRPSKYVPVSLPLFVVVAIVKGTALPPKKMRKPRSFFCELLKSNNEYCSAVKDAFSNPRAFIQKHSNLILEAIEDNVHSKLGRSMKTPFLRYVYAFLPRVVREKIVDMPNVQKALAEDETTNSSYTANSTFSNSTPKSSSNSTSNSYYNSSSNSSKNANTDVNTNPDTNNKVNNSTNTSNSSNSSNSLNTKHTRKVFQYMLDDVPRFTEKMDFQKTREFIVDNYDHFKWPKPQLENLCKTWEVSEPNPKEGGANSTKSFDMNSVTNLLKEMEDEIAKANVKKEVVNTKVYGNSDIATFTPTQNFLRHYFTPDNPYKGMLLWHSVGTGKTCSAIATATSSFEKEGWTILWVTRTTLKDDIWKNMFDTVCSLSMQEKIAKGVRFPTKMIDRMRYVPDNWSIRPMSYKQFTNLVSANNQQYQQLVKKNGQEDPLKKTLLIIDEAHKLYGGYDLLPAEKPDMRKLKAALNRSYTISGKDSVKLLLMTATPYAQDPMEMMKLLNLIKPSNEQIPSSFDEFEHVFLNEKTGKFTEQGKKAFLNNINGIISFLDRGNDAREFAQPKIELVNVNMSLKPELDMEEIKKEYDYKATTLRNAIKELDERFLEYKKVKMQDFRNIVRAKCGNLKGQDYLDCKNDATPEMLDILNVIDSVFNKIAQIKANHTESIKKLTEVFNKQKEVYENNISQEHVLDMKCNKTYKVNTNKKRF